jgi:hypothetical protein
MLTSYYQMLKLDKPHASTKYIVLWISPASTQCTYGVAVKAGNVGECWRSFQTNTGGVSWARTSLFHHISFISFPLRFNSQPNRNMLGYSPRLRLHLGWLIIFLQTMKL